MSDLIEHIRGYCKNVQDGRTKLDVYSHLIGETRELGVEVNLDFYGNPAGEDGITGESVDVILCAFDLIFQDRPDITDVELLRLFLTKLKKWKRKTEAGEYK
jgi:hypothetical protein